MASPDIFLPTLKALFFCFGPLKCSKAGSTLFDKVAWKQALNVLKLGHASEPLEEQIYYKVGEKTNMVLIRCIRGTNSLVGGVHQNFILKFGSFGAGSELADAMLVEYRLRHDLVLGTMDRLGHKYNGRCDPCITQHINLLRRDLRIPHRHIAIAANALNYRGSKEVYGSCPIHFEEIHRLGIARKFDNVQSYPGNSFDNNLTIPKIKDTVIVKLGSTRRPRNAQ